MNIALSAVVIFILLLPPIAFYLAYFFGEFPKAGPKLSLLEGLMVSAIFSIVLHAIAILFINREIKFDIIALLLGGDLKTFNTSVNNVAFRKLFYDFALYNAVLIFISFLAARLIRILAQSSGLHARSELLRLYNHWWYLFNGYKVDRFIHTGRQVPFDIVYIDALVNTNDGTIIYSGYLIDFVCQGEMLDRIYLSETNKREFKKNQTNEHGNARVIDPGEPLEINGDTMAIPYSSIINLNIQFVTFPDELSDLSEVPENPE